MTRRTFLSAREYATSRGDSEVTTGHVLLGLLDEPDSIACVTLEAMGVGLAQLRARVVFALADERHRGDSDGPADALARIDVENTALLAYSPDLVWALVEPTENGLLLQPELVGSATGRTRRRECPARRVSVRA
ncbi:MAG: Clp protease N-terminal domain-containing protein [Galbitalea sp.]